MLIRFVFTMLCNLAIAGVAFAAPSTSTELKAEALFVARTVRCAEILIAAKNHDQVRFRAIASVITTDFNDAARRYPTPQEIGLISTACSAMPYATLHGVITAVFNVIQ